MSQATDQHSTLTRRRFIKRTGQAAVLTAVATPLVIAPAEAMATTAELNNRYQLWLEMERRILSREIGQATPHGTYTWCDRLINEHFWPLDGGVADPPSTRAVQILRAAGVSLDHDPLGFPFGEA